MSTLERDLHGTAWTGNPLELEPGWKTEPDLDAIRQRIQLLRPLNTVRVKFLAEGALNKVYEVEVGDEVFIMRVSLPVDPYYKTTSEVSTMQWVSGATNIPVPRVVTYQPFRPASNLVGFEWILMTKMPGKPLLDLWHSLPYSAKVHIVEDIAVHTSTLFHHKFEGIGSMFRVAGPKIPVSAWPVDRSAYSSSKATKVPKENLIVGRLVSMSFFWGSRMRADIIRGPYETSNDWLGNLLHLIERDCLLVLNSQFSDDDRDLDDDKYHAHETLRIVRKLFELLPSFFPEELAGVRDPSVLVHSDLALRNILVHESGEEAGEISAVLDWECVSTLPLWSACDFPTFLKEPPRHEEPDKTQYATNEVGEPVSLYWEHLFEYETTLLREVFLTVMRALEPRWFVIFKKSQRERDFETAVMNCQNLSLTSHIHAWIDDHNDPEVENPRSLCDRIEND